MSEEEKPVSYEDHHQLNLRKNREREDLREKVRLETIERLKNDAAIQKYFEDYNKSSVESFISGYASYKAGYMIHGDEFGKFHEGKKNESFETAYECLEEIQFKKLFDLYCQWSAEVITLPGTIVWSSFLAWSGNVLNCPVLSPISKSEFNLYMQYAATDGFEIENNFDWLDYCNVRSNTESDDNSCFPEWFSYHNIHTGAGRYLLLPDTRCNKEDFYRGLYWKEQNEITEKKYETGELQRPPKMDERPWLRHYHYKVTEDFVKRFEDDAARKKFFKYEDYFHQLDRNPEGDDQWLKERLETVISDLSDLKPPPPIEANMDWRRGLYNTWLRYRKDEIREALPVAYQDYLFHIDNKIPFKADRYDNYNDFVKTALEQIYRGRVLNGEEEDLNF
jgi:hypothetical protein